METGTTKKIVLHVHNPIVGENVYRATDTYRAGCYAARPKPRSCAGAMGISSFERSSSWAGHVPRTGSVIILPHPKKVLRMHYLHVILPGVEPLRGEVRARGGRFVFRCAGVRCQHVDALKALAKGVELVAKSFGASESNAQVRLIADYDKAPIDYMPVEVLASCVPAPENLLANFLQHLHDQNIVRSAAFASRAEYHEQFRTLASDYMRSESWGTMVALVGDITKLEVDAIVNSANRSLVGGSGVNGAIHTAAGPGLLSECRTLNGCHTGDATITGGHLLPAAHVIHTVGPVWAGGTKDEDRLLAQCYRRCLEVAVENELRSIAFPAISTGVFGFPFERAAGIAVRTVSVFLSTSPGIDEVVFCCFTEQSAKVYRAELGSFR